MKVTLHDGFGHAAEAVMAAETEHGHPHGSALMRHRATCGKDPATALLDALLGRDPKALELARDDNDEDGVASDHDTGVLESLAAVCGGVDVNVAVALAPYLDGEASLEGEDGSGVAWRDGRIDMQMPLTGAILRSDGIVWLGMELPQSVAASAAGRTIGEILELPGFDEARRIAGVTSAEGETKIVLAA